MIGDNDLITRCKHISRNNNASMLKFVYRGLKKTLKYFIKYDGVTDYIHYYLPN